MAADEASRITASLFLRCIFNPIPIAEEILVAQVKHNFRRF